MAFLCNANRICQEPLPLWVSVALSLESAHPEASSQLGHSWAMEPGLGQTIYQWLSLAKPQVSVPGVCGSDHPVCFCSLRLR